MQKEAIRESLFVAQQSILFRKQSIEWPDNEVGGCLGYPAAILLLAVIGTFGALHKTRGILVDGATIIINEPKTHFYILNDPLFGLHLSKEELDKIYSTFRHTLFHNQHILPGSSLEVGGERDEPFSFSKHHKYATMRLLPLLTCCVRAFDAWSKDAL